MSLGIHVSKTRNSTTRKMSLAIREDMEFLHGFGVVKPCAQIFVTGPQNFKETLSDDEKIAVRRYINETNLPVVIHGAYVDHPWNRTHGSIHNIKQEMNICAAICAVGVIVHLGAGAASDDKLKYVLENISNLSDDVKSNVILWLEINAAKPSATTYETPEKICELFRRISAIDTKGLKIGLCIDTAHLFSCGVALNTRDAAQEWLDGLPKNIPMMLHLNDSSAEFGSGVDRHETLCEGGIWKEYHPVNGHAEDSGLVTILEWAESNNVMTILERNEEGVIKDLNLIRQLGFFST